LSHAVESRLRFSRDFPLLRRAFGISPPGAQIYSSDGSYLLRNTMIDRLHQLRETRGVLGTLRYAIQVAPRMMREHPEWHYHRRLCFAGAVFILGAQRYRYFAHPYNWTWDNERAVEIPIVWRIVQQHRGKRILEVGHVLGHYFRFPHDVIDKYERAPGVLNTDVLNFQPEQPYDLIVSISTIEHVGWHDDRRGWQREPRDPHLASVAIEHLAELLTPGGQLVITFGVDQHPGLDRLVRDDRLPFDQVGYLRRTSRWNRWKEVERSQVLDSQYGQPFPCANAVVVGIRNGPDPTSRSY